MEIQTEQSNLPLGRQAPYFSLLATDGKIYSISDFVGRSSLAVIFMSNHCPYARAYEKRLVILAELFQQKDAALVAICSNDSVGFPEDSYEKMVENSTRYSFPYPYLWDENQSVARAYDAKCTPEAFLFDSQMRLVYHGAIDDNYADADRVEHHFLAIALEAALQNKLCPTPFTKALGCSIKWKR